MAVASEKPDWLAGTSTLKGPLLMLLLERPGHAYDIATRLSQRVGPAWAIDPNDIYPIVKRFESKGLVAGRHEQDPERPHKQLYVYDLTELGLQAAIEWISTPVSLEPERSELLAMFAVLGEEHAPELLRKLEEYERNCYLAAAASEREIPTEAWRGLLMELARKSVVEGLESKIKWIETARDWIEERQASTSESLRASSLTARDSTRPVRRRRPASGR
jgi:DNA-binding PadR family transcriptional regulator